MLDEMNSNQALRPLKTAYQDSQTESIDSKGGSVQVAKQVVEDKSQLILTILAIVLAAFAIGQNIAENSARERERQDLNQIIDAKVKAGVAESLQAMGQQVADAKASANTAREHARVALDKVEQTQVQLGAKGLVQPSTH